MKNLDQLSFKGKRVLIRVDFNVPLNKDLTISDDSRIIAALPTIKKVMSSKGKAIILSHMGRPKGVSKKSLSLKNIIERLSFLLNYPVIFIENFIKNDAVSVVNSAKEGSVILLENLRFYPEEKSGDFSFSESLSKLGDVYINDAFGTLHREHASTATIAKFFPNNKAFGYLVCNELSTLEKVSKNPLRPLTAIIGGAKISGKIDVITSLFERVNNLIIGGGMAYTFIKALGGEVANSLVEIKKLELAKHLIKQAKEKKVNLLLPIDSINGSSFDNECEINCSDIRNIPSGFIGLDIGVETIALFKKTILNSKTIIWNGPMGVFELDNFSNGTKEIGKAISLATKNGAFSLVGGGDSVSAIKKFKLENQVSYVSTGGGAMLKYLEGKELPGIISVES